VLTHWKEREPVYRSRRRRLEAEKGFVPAYAGEGGDVEPVVKRPRRGGRLTQPDPETVSAAEFEEMKRGLEVEAPGRQTSTLTKKPAAPPVPAPARPAPKPKPQPQREGADAARAPDVAENEGVAPVQKPKRAAKSRPRNRRHGRRR
jgi:SecD/SecF fusion protein